ncbi:SpoIIE family protein phosphatase [Streptomyces sp. NPDC051217]|uniref:SpoIIE family protein phosphatase n=1 Tax=Streptomyces sp. NPDC051217 TaxID=3365644 RepID=UPI003795B928
MSAEPPPGPPPPGPTDSSELDWPADPGVTLAHNRMGSFDIDLPSEAMHLDPGALKVFDLRPDEFQGDMAVASRVPPEELERLNTLIRRSVKGGKDVYGAYFQIHCRDGSPRWLHTQGHLLRNAEGVAYRVIGIVRDATRELDDAAKRIELVETRRRLTGMVRRVTALLARATTVNDVTDALKDTEALSNLGAVSVMLGIVEKGRVHLVSEGRIGLYVPELQYTRIDGKFPMSEVVRTLRPRYITSRDEFRRCFPPLWEHIEHLPVASGAYLPLIAQGRPIGVLGMLYSRHGGFTGEERNLLITLSSSIAQSLQRAMLFDQEHDLAESLQQAMLPHRIPEVPGAEIAFRYRAARAGRDVGGDWYDVIPLPGNRVGLMIGDVQGHDTDAAAVMGQLRIVLWAYVSEEHSPATAMARASTFLHELDTERFATCTYVEVDLSTGGLQIVRAGHLEPMVRCGDGSCVTLTTEGGLPLGIADGAGRRGAVDYPVTRANFVPGETLLIYTDGLVERPGASLDAGLDRLARAVQDGPDDVQELADRLGGMVGEHGGGDDVALLLMRWVPQRAAYHGPATTGAR